MVYHFSTARSNNPGDPKAICDVPSQANKISPLVPWLIWGLGAVVFGYGFFQRVAPGVMVDPLMRDFAVTGAVLGNLSAVYFYAYALTQVPAGLLVDAYGSRRLLIVAATLLAAGSLIFALAETVFQAFAGRLVIGLGAGATFVIGLNLAAQWHPKQRFALLSGLTLSFGVLGALAGQMPLAWGVETFGWRDAMRVASQFALVACVATWFIMGVPRPGPRKAPPLAPGQSFRSVLIRRETWVLTAAGAGTMSIMLSFGGLWAVPWLTQVHGLTRPEAALLVSLNALGWGLGAPFLGWLSGRLGGRRLPYMAATLFSVACYAALVYWPGAPKAALAALLFAQGLGTGAVVLVFTETHERFSGGREGAAVGIVNTGIMLFAAALQAVIGWVLDLNWRGGLLDGARLYDAPAYQAGLTLLAVSGVVAVIAGFIMAPARQDRDVR